MKNNIIFFISFFVINVSFASATVQEQDIIIYNSIKYDLHQSPILSYFRQYPEKRPKSQYRKSSNWRGYVAKYELTNDKLYITDLFIDVRILEGNENSNVKKISIFKNIFLQKNKFFLNCYSNILEIPTGRAVKNEHLRFGSKYEKYLLFYIKNGNVLKKGEFDYKQYLKIRKIWYYELFNM